MPRLIDEPEVTSIDSTWYIPVASQTGVKRILPGNLPVVRDLPINVKQFGAMGDGTTDDTTAVQAALNYCGPLGRRIFFPKGNYKITASLTATSGWFVRMFGEGKTHLNSAADEFGVSCLTFAPASGTELFATNGAIYFEICDLMFNTASAVQLNAVRIGILGNYTSQTASQATSKISGCAFYGFMGTALTLGGECYLEISECDFDKNHQAICIDGQGEIAIRHCTAITSVSNGTFTPPETEATSMIFVARTKIKVLDCNFQTDQNVYDVCKFYNCDTVVFENNTIEHAGQTLTSFHDVNIKCDSSSTPTYLAKIAGNTLLKSSLTNAAHTGRIIATTISGTGRIYSLSITDNTLTYSSVATIPICDTSGGTPDATRLGGNFWSPGTVAFLRITHTASPSANQAWQGISVAEARKVVQNSSSFVVAQSQTGTFVPLFGTGLIRFLGAIETVQRFPLWISIQTDGNPTGVISFYASHDTGKAHAVTLGATDTLKSALVQPITNLNSAIDTTAEQILAILYDSDGSVSTTVKYVLTIAYMEIPCPYSPNGGKGMLEVI